MPIIDSRSDSKFDALIRTNKADSLMSFIMATYNVKKTENRKSEVANRLKSAYELFRENIKGSDSGAGSYGQGERDIADQFESHYTMGYEMGIWQDSDFTLSPLAIKVAKYEITVSEYIGIVFTNLFTFFTKNGESVYHHFLYEILNSAISKGFIDSAIPKSVIVETLPIEKKIEQGNMIFHYLVATNFFTQIDKDHFKLSTEWENKSEKLLAMCNLEYKEVSQEEAMEMAKDKNKYATYITKTKVIDLDTDFFEDNKEEIEVDFDNVERFKGGVNTLLYGVPGSGKSWTIEKEYCDDESRMERLVFHPDYTYSDFIGQILPNVSDGIVSYMFTEGPFTSLLKKAYTHPDKMFFLVIEEINRGNAPAIFGEVFQLLDRNDDGTSEYGITNVDIARIVYGNPDKKVRIPSNMSIVGTMNTSDQNVFTLDTAFQRRWNMRMIENTFEGHDYARTTILDTDVTWQRFCEVINNEIVTKNIRMTSSEDKRLGTYFIRAADLEYHEDADNNNLSEKEQIQARLLNYRFGEKVLKYLWDDAFKFSREDIFKNTIYKSLEEVVNHFNSRSSAKAIGNARLDVFKDEIKDAFLAQDEDNNIVE